jgi:hypothetical protein
MRPKAAPAPFFESRATTIAISYLNRMTVTPPSKSTKMFARNITVTLE